jgi:hypothetical protein
MIFLDDAREHLPERPTWDCRRCGGNWPCVPARERLLSEIDRSSLAVYMWLNLHDAVMELDAMPVAELFDRFIAWTHFGTPSG